MDIFLLPPKSRCPPLHHLLTSLAWTACTFPKAACPVDLAVEAPSHALYQVHLPLEQWLITKMYASASHDPCKYHRLCSLRLTS